MSILFGLLAMGCAVSASAAAPSLHAWLGTPIKSVRIGMQAGGFSEGAKLQRGRQYFIVARQFNADIVVRILDPASREIIMVDAPTYRLGFETLLIRAALSGEYRIDARPKGVQGRWGTVDLRVHSVPPTGGALLQAISLETEAAAQFAAATESSRTASAETYSKAITLWDSLGRPQEAAQAALRLGWLRYAWLEEWEDAAALADRARRDLATPAIDALLASAILLQALARIEIAQTAAPAEQLRLLEEAIVDLELAGASFARLDLGYEQAFARNNIGLALHYLGRSSEAIEVFKAAAADFARMEERAGEAMAVQNVGWARFEQGDYSAARADYLRALRMLDDFDDPPQRLFILNNLALANSILGEFERAVELYRDAYTLAQSLGEESEQARALSGWGGAYARAGYVDRALQMFIRALDLRKKPSRGKVSTLLRLGDLRRERQELGEARRLHAEALAIASLPLDRARAQVALGQDLAAAGDLAGAISAFERAVHENLAAQNEIRGVALMEQGRALTAQRRFTEGIAALDSAIAIHRVNGSAIYLSLSHAARARARRMIDDAPGARADVDLAMDLSERGRARLASPDMRATFLSTRAAILDEKLLQLTATIPASPAADDAVAISSLLAAERWRASGLRDRQRLRRDAIQEDLVDARRKQQDRLVSASYQLEVLQDRRHANRGQIQAVVATIADSEAQLDRLDAREAGDRLDRVVQRFDSAALQALQARLHRTAIVAFTIGDEAGWRWTIRRSTIDVKRLSGRAILEPNVTRALSCIRQAPSGRDQRDHCASSTAALSAQLFSDAALGHEERLVIVPDGFLSAIPFGALPRSAALPAHRLLEDYTVVIAPAVSLLQPANAPRESADTLRLALVADPVYRITDARLTAPGPMASGGDALDLDRLSGAEQEARIVESVWRGPRLVLTGLDARRDAVLERVIGSSDVLHIATHVSLNYDNPDLSRIELARYDRSGRPLISGISPRDLRNSDLDALLVVLSGCDSASGRELRGEGVLGFNQSLLGAGARHVVASLWRVSDRSTRALMVAFYRDLASEERSIAAALRSAQLTMLNSREYAQPFHWASFQAYSSEI